MGHVAVTPNEASNIASLTGNSHESQQLCMQHACWRECKGA